MSLLFFLTSLVSQLCYNHKKFKFFSAFYVVLLKNFKLWPEPFFFIYFKLLQQRRRHTTKKKCFRPKMPSGSFHPFIHIKYLKKIPICVCGIEKKRAASFDYHRVLSLSLAVGGSGLKKKRK